MKKLFTLSIISILALTGCFGGGEEEAVETTEQLGQTQIETPTRLSNEELAEQVGKDLELSTQAHQDYNPEICENITDSNERTACKITVTTNKAILEKDPSGCDSIEDEQFSIECKIMATE